MSKALWSMKRGVMIVVAATTFFNAQAASLFVTKINNASSEFDIKYHSEIEEKIIKAGTSADLRLGFALKPEKNESFLLYKKPAQLTSRFHEKGMSVGIAVSHPPQSRTLYINFKLAQVESVPDLSSVLKDLYEQPAKNELPVPLDGEAFETSLVCKTDIYELELNKDIDLTSGIGYCELTIYYPKKDSLFPMVMLVPLKTAESLKLVEVPFEIENSLYLSAQDGDTPENDPLFPLRAQKVQGAKNIETFYFSFLKNSESSPFHA